MLDTSGSMMGFPIEKATELINHAFDELYPGDTFNVITFSGDTRILFPQPVFPTVENLRKAREVLNAQHGSGGTEMMNAIRAALVPSDSQDHVRIVTYRLLPDTGRVYVARCGGRYVHVTGAHPKRVVFSEPPIQIGGFWFLKHISPMRQMGGSVV